MLLLPGTCYIEFVRVVVVALHELQLYSLDEVNFQTIMFLDDDANVFGAPFIRLRLESFERGVQHLFEARRGGVDDARRHEASAARRVDDADASST